jgi:hypothetical protein
MIKLEKSEKLGRIIRRDDAPDLAIPTWNLVREAIRAGKGDEALKFLDYGYSEMKVMHDSMCSYVDDALTHLSNFGEEEIYKVIRKRYEPVIRNWIRDTPVAKESVERGLEFQRGHGGKSTVKEEADRFVVTCDPCGSGGQMRRVKNLGIVKKAYDWTWKKSGVSYYCTHCAIAWEILPIDLRGFPIRINLMGEKPEDPCVHLYYKKREQIPREYFERVGRSPK